MSVHVAQPSISWHRSRHSTSTANAGIVCVTRHIDLLPFEPNVKHLYAKFGGRRPSYIGFSDIVR